jgi:CRP-like cAMP-binding protein
MNDIGMSAEDANTLRMLAQIPLFAGIGIHEQHLVASKCHLVSFPPDKIVIEQNEQSNNLFIILSGKVIVSKKTLSHGWVKVNTLGKGDFFGEIALLRNVRRTARVTTETGCSFLTINGTDFLDIYKFFPPQSCNNIQIIIAKRLAELAHLI